MSFYKIFTTASWNKKETVKFSIKIPHLTSTVHRLLSDHQLCWKQPILASYPFLVLRHKRSPRLCIPFSSARSERRKIQAQNDRAATNPTQNPSTYTAVSCQITNSSILLVKPTLSRTLLPKFSGIDVSNDPPSHSPRRTTIKTSLVTLLLQAWASPRTTRAVVNIPYKLSWSLDRLWIDWELWSTRISQVCR